MMAIASTSSAGNGQNHFVRVPSGKALCVLHVISAGGKDETQVDSRRLYLVQPYERSGPTSIVLRLSHSGNVFTVPTGALQFGLPRTFFASREVQLAVKFDSNEPSSVTSGTD